VVVVAGSVVVVAVVAALICVGGGTALVVGASAAGPSLPQPAAPRTNTHIAMIRNLCINHTSRADVVANRLGRTAYGTVAQLLRALTGSVASDRAHLNR
jgi:hypothetical protein